MENPNEATMKIALALQEVAGALDEVLKELAGKRVAFVLAVQADTTAQYVSNVSREDGTGLLQSLLNRWEAGRADIPAYCNPDLTQ